MHAIATLENFDNEIKTDDFILRIVCANDYEDAWLAMMNRHDVKTGLNLSNPPTTDAECKAILNSYNTNEKRLFGIYSKEPRQLAGFYILDIDSKNRTGIVAFVANTQIAHNIIGRTCDAFLDYCFEHLNIDKVSGRIIQHNKKALYVVLNTPRFELESILKKDCLLGSTTRTDVLIWSAFKYPTNPCNALVSEPQQDNDLALDQQQSVDFINTNLDTKNTKIKKNKKPKKSKNKPDKKKCEKDKKSETKQKKS